MSDETLLQIEKLTFEKRAIEESLTEIQEKLKTAFHEKNEYEVRARTHVGMSYGMYTHSILPPQCYTLHR